MMTGSTDAHTYARARGGHIHPAAQCKRTLASRPAAPWVPGALACRCVQGASGTADKGDVATGSLCSIILHGKLLENNWKITGQQVCAVVESE